MKKICSKCKCEFDGKIGYCNECRLEYHRKYQREYRKKNKAIIVKKNIEYYQNNKDFVLKYHREYRRKNKDIIVKQRLRYYQKNRDSILKRKRKYRLNNKESIKQQNRRYKTKKMLDPQFKVNQYISSSISISLKGDKGSRHWEDLVGYTLSSLIKHLEKQFINGMTWENYGEWHVDHITPKSVFNFTKPEHIDFKRCWALKNLQPLWKKDNLKKGIKREGYFQPSLKLAF